MARTRCMVTGRVVMVLCVGAWYVEHSNLGTIPNIGHVVGKVRKSHGHNDGRIVNLGELKLLSESFGDKLQPNYCSVTEL